MNPDAQVAKLLAFNVGIEVGQVTAIVGLLSTAAVVAMTIGRTKTAALEKPAGALLFALGAVAAPLMVLDQLG